MYIRVYITVIINIRCCFVYNSLHKHCYEHLNMKIFLAYLTQNKGISMQLFLRYIIFNHIMVLYIDWLIFLSLTVTFTCIIKFVCHCTNVSIFLLSFYVSVIWSISNKISQSNNKWFKFSFILFSCSERVCWKWTPWKFMLNILCILCKCSKNVLINFAEIPECTFL